MAHGRKVLDDGKMKGINQFATHFIGWEFTRSTFSNFKIWPQFFSIGCNYFKNLYLHQFVIFEKYQPYRQRFILKCIEFFDREGMKIFINRGRERKSSLEIIQKKLLSFIKNSSHINKSDCIGQIENFILHDVLMTVCRNKEHRRKSHT